MSIDRKSAEVVARLKTESGMDVMGYWLNETLFDAATRIHDLAGTVTRADAMIADLRAEVARLTTELTVANNRLGNAVGAIIDAGNHYCTGPADVADAIYRLTTETGLAHMVAAAASNWWLARAGADGFDLDDCESELSHWVGEYQFERARRAVEIEDAAGGLLQDGDPTPDEEQSNG